MVSSRNAFEEFTKKLARYPVSYLGNNIYELHNLKTSDLEKLINENSVCYIDAGNRLAKEERLMDNSDLSINKASQVHHLYPDISGEGITLCIKEGLFDTTDVDFINRIVHLERAGQKLSFHATSMATLAAGAGNTDPKGKGVAWKASISSSSYDNLLPDNEEWLKSKGISVQNHSYGTGIENYYGIESMEYDSQTLSYPEIVHVFSSGNSGLESPDHSTYKNIPGFANLTGQFKMSKNIITVGELDVQNHIKAVSSKGPAFDGRVKPELVAYGDLGSSESAALVSGISVLVQDALKKQNFQLPSAELVKAIMINSANDVGRPEVDFEAGYGSADALGAIQTTIEKRYQTGSLINSQELRHIISIPDNIAKLKVTLVWHDAEAKPNTNRALVNDLDLELTSSNTGQIWEPWILNHYPHIDSLKQNAKRGKDHLNNIEQISVTNPNKGQYEIIIKGSTVTTSTQTYSLAWEFEEDGFYWLNPFNRNTAEAATPIRLSWSWHGPGINGELQYQDISEGKWYLIDNEIDLSDEYYEWLTPDEIRLIKFRMICGSDTYDSDTLLISPCLQMHTGLFCDNELMLHWSQVENASSYQVYQVSNTHIKAYKVISDTLIFIPEEDMRYHHYAVSPVIEGHAGRRSRSINYLSSGTGCYIRSFFPQSYVTDTVLLQLELASNYQLSSITLERMINGAFKPVQNVNELYDIKFTLEDPRPNQRNNTYRVKLQREDKKIIYSDPVNVFYSRPGSLWIYPNPAQSGQEVNLINGEDGSDEILLYDPSGRLIRSYVSNYGLIKSIPTNGLKRGIYIMKVKTESGYRKTCKLMIQ
ncbi:S8 family peptidase [Carboxylicivirga sp. RSCT41]|uniref:S8 family peptidase n=1 Tax=Carboxylicivirga agarovorans TaxID=3417570 RepID=UPI003D32D636